MFSEDPEERISRDVEAIKDRNRNRLLLDLTQSSEGHYNAVKEVAEIILKQFEVTVPLKTEEQRAGYCDWQLLKQGVEMIFSKIDEMAQTALKELNSDLDEEQDEWTNLAE